MNLWGYLRPKRPLLPHLTHQTSWQVNVLSVIELTTASVVDRRVESRR